MTRPDGAKPDAARPDGATLRQWFEAGLEAHGRDDLAAAIGHYRRVAAAAPDYAPVWVNLGIALRAGGRIDAGVACLQRGVALRPEDASARSNLGNALRAAGRLDEARAAHEAAVARDGAAGAFRYNLGLVLRDLGELDAALASFEAARQRGYDRPEMYWDRALALLLKGDLSAGFGDYDRRWALAEAKPRSFAQPEWNGENHGDGPLLVYAEQGFGDTIQFVRYLPLLAARVPEVIFEVQAPLLRLVRGSPIARGIRTVERDRPLPDFAAQVALLSLPRLLGTTADNVPAEVPYLAPPRPAGDVALPAVGPALRVGLVWAGKPTHRNDRNRSMALSTLAPILEVAGVIFVSLQLGAPADEIARGGFSPLVRDLRDRIGDFADTAAIVDRLDLVIGVDTSLVHLAGALGKEVWTLLPFAPDWRWQTGREDSPWYPTMRLFRQDCPRDWTGAVARAAAALRDRRAAGGKVPL